MVASRWQGAWTGVGAHVKVGEVDPATLKAGISVEYEHVTHLKNRRMARAIATRIAIDHIWETRIPGAFPYESNYYRYLAQIEKRMEHENDRRRKANKSRR